MYPSCLSSNCCNFWLLMSIVVAWVASDDIPLPTYPQFKYQKGEVVGLTHFNMATFFRDADPGCNSTNWYLSGNPASFNPTQLNISNWIEHYKAIGAKSAVLTAKHGCGFLLWPTNVTIPSTGKLYNYTVQYSSYPKDIIKEFAQLCQENGLGYGFYYSLTNNFFLNVRNGAVQNNKLLPGQMNVTQSEFEQIALAHLTELFTNYGNLTEFWFDGGTFNISGKVAELLSKYQPQTAVFNGQDVSANMVRWIGTETGLINNPIWSLGDSTGVGDPNSDQFCPACVDTTLQTHDHWFYQPGTSVKNLSRMITTYHDSVGNNGVLELDFGIDRTGNVHPSHSVRYKQLGAWIDACYTTSLMEETGVVYNSTSGGNSNGFVFELSDFEIEFDRAMIQEDLEQGQRIRKFEINVNNGEYVVSSTSVGYKRIILFDKVFSTPATVMFNVTEMVGETQNVRFAIYESLFCTESSVTGQ